MKTAKVVTLPDDDLENPPIVVASLSTIIPARRSETEQGGKAASFFGVQSAVVGHMIKKESGSNNKGLPVSVLIGNTFLWQLAKPMHTPRS